MSLKGLSLFNSDRKKKGGVLLALPSLHGFSRTEQLFRTSELARAPFHIEPYLLLYKSPVSDARNECTQYFYEKTKLDYLYFWDHDMIPPPNWTHLIGRGDVVSGITFMWNGNRKPNQRLQMNQFIINDQNVSETVIPVIRSAPYEVDQVGTACMVIHRRVFDKLGPRPFQEPTGPDGKKQMGEDMYFCRAVRGANFKITIIPSVQFNHVKEVGLNEVYETICEMMKMAGEAGYQRAVEEIKAQVAASQPQPNLDQQMGGGAA
jgi:hypothetical protein